MRQLSEFYFDLNLFLLNETWDGFKHEVIYSHRVYSRSFPVRKFMRIYKKVLIYSHRFILTNLFLWESLWEYFILTSVNHALEWKTRIQKYLLWTWAKKIIYQPTHFIFQQSGYGKQFVKDCLSNYYLFLSRIYKILFR